MGAVVAQPLVAAAQRLRTPDVAQQFGVGTENGVSRFRVRDHSLTVVAQYRRTAFQSRDREGAVCGLTANSTTSGVRRLVYRDAFGARSRHGAYCARLLARRPGEFAGKSFPSVDGVADEVEQLLAVAIGAEVVGDAAGFCDDRVVAMAQVREPERLTEVGGADAGGIGEGQFDLNAPSAPSHDFIGTARRPA